jgi:hypothetical protein
MQFTELDLYELANKMHSRMNNMQMATQEVRCFNRHLLEDLAMHHSVSVFANDSAKYNTFMHRVLELFPMGR